MNDAFVNVIVKEKGNPQPTFIESDHSEKLLLQASYLPHRRTSDEVLGNLFTCPDGSRAEAFHPFSGRHITSKSA